MKKVIMVLFLIIVLSVLVSGHINAGSIDAGDIVNGNWYFNGYSVTPAGRMPIKGILYFRYDRKRKLLLQDDGTYIYKNCKVTGMTIRGTTRIISTGSMAQVTITFKDRDNGIMTTNIFPSRNEKHAGARLEYKLTRKK